MAPKKKETNNKRKRVLTPAEIEKMEATAKKIAISKGHSNLKKFIKEIRELNARSSGYMISQNFSDAVYTQTRKNFQKGAMTAAVFAQKYNEENHIVFVLIILEAMLTLFAEARITHYPEDRHFLIPKLASLQVMQSDGLQAALVDKDAMKSDALKLYPFGDKVQPKRTLVATAPCTTCQGDVAVAACVPCNAAQPHFICYACINAAVLYTIQPGNQVMLREAAAVSKIGCSFPCSECEAGISLTPLAEAIGSLNGNMGLLDSLVQGVMAVKIQDAVNAEQTRHAAQAAVVPDAAAVRIALIARFIEIFNMRCPCGMPFDDFVGCCALECSRCRNSFCAWCLMTFAATEADSSSRRCHVHVARECLVHLTPSYYALLKDWQHFHNNRKMEEADAFLRTLPKELAIGIVNQHRELLLQLNQDELLRKYQEEDPDIEIIPFDPGYRSE